MKLILFLSLVFTIGSSISATCPEGAVFNVNGDSGGGDNCEFYTDISRMERVVSSDECREILVPPKKPANLPPNLQGYGCQGIVNSYFKRGTASNKANFKDKLEATLFKGGEKSIVTITDHGAKLALDKCEDEECIEKKFQRESYASIGTDRISESELRTMIKESREKQKKELCKDKNPCEIPPMIMNFDHCYSGGMLNAFFDENGSPMEGVCGISASSADELAYTGENIAKGINELNLGVKGKYRANYAAYDLNKDQKFSLDEVYNYVNKKALRSVPLKSSDKYLLDYFEKNHLNPSDLQCSNVSDDEFLKDISKIKAELNYAQQMDEFKNKAKSFSSPKKDLGPEDIEGLVSKEKDALKLMKIDEDQDQFILEIINQTIEDFKAKSYKDVEHAYDERRIANNELRKTKQEFCLKNESCQKLNDEIALANKLLMEEEDSKKSSEILMKISTLDEKQEKIFTDKMIENPCDADCKLLNDKKKDYVGKKEVEKETRDDLLKNKTDELISKNKEVLENFFSKINDVTKPYGNKEINEFVKQQKSQALQTKNLQKGDAGEFYDPLIIFQENLAQKLKINHASSHRQYITNRKALNQLKMGASLKSLIKNADEKRIKEYEALKKCEQTTIFSYK